MKFNLKIKPIHTILLLTIFIVCLYQTYTIVEGYQSYDECVNQGYPLDFCLEVPAQAQVTMPTSRPQLPMPTSRPQAQLPLR